MEGSARRRIAGNAAVQLAGKAVVLLIAAASVAVLTRYLGTAGYGRLSLALAFVQVLGVLADIGLLTIVVREISKRPERTPELVGNAMTMRLALSVAVIALSGLVSLLLPYTGQVRVAILIAGAPLLLGLLNTSLVAVFQARLEMGRVVIADIAGRAAGFAAAVLVVVLDLGFYAVVATAGVGALITLLVTARFARRVVPLAFRVDRSVWRELFVASLPLGLALALNEIYFRADTLIISLSRSFEDVGLYALAFRIVEFGSFFTTILLTSMFPVLARYVAADEPRARGAIQAASDLFLVLAVPAAAAGYFLAPGLIDVVGGSDFRGAIDPLRVLLVSGAFAFVNGLFGYALIAKDRQASALWLNAAALALNLGLNVALVPSYGIDAAAVVAVVSELVILAGSYLLMRRYFDFFPRVGILARAALAAAAMAGLLWPIRDEPLWLLAPVAVLSYSTALYLLGGVDRAALRGWRE